MPAVWTVIGDRLDRIRQQGSAAGLASDFRISPDQRFLDLLGALGAYPRNLFAFVPSRAKEAVQNYSRADLEPDEVFRWLTTFRWRAIFTTNHDDAKETAIRSLPSPEPSLNVSHGGARLH
jgi:hypothetical protein